MEFPKVWFASQIKRILKYKIHLRFLDKFLVVDFKKTEGVPFLKAEIFAFVESPL